MNDSDIQQQKQFQQQQQRTLPDNRGSVQSQQSLRQNNNNSNSNLNPASNLHNNPNSETSGGGGGGASQQQQQQYNKQGSSASIQRGITNGGGAQQTYNKWETHTHMYKIVLVGDAGVGKTHIINRYVKGTLPHAIIPTIGIEFATKTVTLRDGGSIKTQIWDTAGQEKYRSITSAHYRKAVGALLVYDITKEKSFEAIQRWLKEIRLHADPQIVLLLVGNKLDLATQTPQQRRVSKDEAALFAKENNLLFEESSALYDVNITDAFERLLEEIYDQKCRIQSERSIVNMTEHEDPQNLHLHASQNRRGLELKNHSANNNNHTHTPNANGSFCSCN